MKVNRWRLWLYGVWAVSEVLLFGGLLYGWPSLLFLLKQRHVFSQLCQQDVTTSSRHNTTFPQLNGNSPSNPTIRDALVTESASVKNRQKQFLDVSVFTTEDAMTNFTEHVSTRPTLFPAMKASSRATSLSNSTSMLDFYYISTENRTSSLLEDEDSTSPGAGVEEVGDCVEQDEAFALAYTVITAVTAVGSVGVGHVQRVLGIRTTRIVFGATYVAGLLMVGFITPDRPALLYTGMTCIGVAGLSLLITNVQLGVLYGRGRTTFVSLLSGCFDVSAIMQLLIKIVISSGADYLYTYLGVAALSCLTFVSTLLWLPREHVLKLSELDSTLRSKTKVSADDEVSEAVKHQPYITSSKLLSSMTSPLYVLHVLWFALLTLRLFFFWGVLNRWLTELTEGNMDEVDHYTSVQLYTGIGSVLFAIMAGSLYDFQRHRYKDADSRERRHLGSAVLPLLLGSALCFAMSVLSLVNKTYVLYILFVLLAAFRSVTYSMAVAFLVVTFPAELFGMLYGTMVISAGAIAFLQYPLFIWAEPSITAIFHVNIFLLCTTALTFLHPLHLIWKCQRSQATRSAPLHPQPNSAPRTELNESSKQTPDHGVHNAGEVQGARSVDGRLLVKESLDIVNSNVCADKQ